MYDVLIIGAGIAGTCIARELSRYDLKIALVDKENDVANGTTMANSAIIHAGYDAKANKNKGKFNAAGNAMYKELCEELDVPYEQVGSLVIGFSEEDMKTIKVLYDNGIKNGVPHIEIIDGEQVRQLEPNLRDSVVGALLAPTAGIISPWEMAIALAENAVDNGTDLQLGRHVTDIQQNEGRYKVIFEDGDVIEARYIINCAGVYADQIARLVGDNSYNIRPRKGQYYILDKSVGDLVKHVIFQCPTEKGKGILLAPTVHGNILVGPDSEYVDHKDDLSTTSDRLAYIKETAILSSKEIPYNKVIRSFSGLRATADRGDFIIEESDVAEGFIHVGGFESPGLSSAPAVALHVVSMIKALAGGLVAKEDFNPRRRKYIQFDSLSLEEKQAIIHKDSSYGRIICRCETVTEGEIVDVIHRSAGATTVKGVKKRTRAGMGRCQGGFCSPKVMEILARELEVDMMDIVLDHRDSYILSGKTKNV